MYSSIVAGGGCLGSMVPPELILVGIFTTDERRWTRIFAFLPAQYFVFRRYVLCSSDCWRFADDLLQSEAVLPILRLGERWAIRQAYLRSS